MRKKSIFTVSFALLVVLAAAQIGFAAGNDDKDTRGTDKPFGMTDMMKDADMGKMMQAMQSPEGQTMMKACGEFMESYNQKN